MSTILSPLGDKYKQLKGKSFDEIQKLFDKEMKRVNTFVAMGSEVQESKEKKVEGSEETAKGSRKKMLRRKRAGKEQQQESSKKQRMEEDKDSDEVEEVSKDDEGELMKHLVIKKDEDITIKAIPLDTKLPVIIDYKLIKKIVKTKYSDIRPEDEFKRVLWGDLKVMFEPDKRSDVWRILQGYMVTIWKLIDSFGVHFVSGVSIQTYATSVTKKKAGRLWDTSERFEDLAQTPCGVKESAHDVYSRNRILAITKLKIDEWYNYKNLDWITVRRNDDKLYTFKEGDYNRLRLQDIEDMLLLLVQGKLTNLNVEERLAGNPVKKILLKLNLSDHRSILTDLKAIIKMVVEVLIPS
ncbi:hypothetical protein Tco_0040659 [Tanacetum coccineum]